jgi:serine/threonine protein kinase
VEELPAIFGRYELIELLATGGMAHIFRARLSSAEGAAKELVIKRVLPHLVQNRDFIEMFIDEARISMPLNHGNIIQVYEFGQVGQNYFLAMEYLRGRNLETVLTRLEEKGQRIPVPVALFIASEVAKGLDYAHRFRDPHDRPTGIIHRDVSPQNIMVGFHGEVKLTDFGIAKAKSRIRQTGQGIIRGKACYLSPEQAECADLDGRSDLFSLATVLYEMLAGVRVFEGDTEVATLQRVRQATVRPLTQLRSDVPRQVDGAVLKALSRDRSDRFDTAGAFQVVLSRALHDLDPEFTSASVADWMRTLFSDDITREITERTTKERMLERLKQENAGMDASKLTTGEILQMGTLSIKSDKVPRAQPARGRRWILVLLPVVLILGAGVGVWAGWPAIREWLAGGGNGPAGADDAGASDAEPVDQDAGAAVDDRADAKPPPADLPARIQYGYLDLNAAPWAYVEIDGKRQEKETPLFGVRVRAGKHRLRFFNPELKLEKTMTITVRPNKTEPVIIRLNEP